MFGQNTAFYLLQILMGIGNTFNTMSGIIAPLSVEAMTLSVKGRVLDWRMQHWI